MREKRLKKAFLEHFDDFKAVSVTAYKTALHDRQAGQEIDLSPLEDFSTIVVLALSYPKERPAFCGEGYGYISRYAHGRDYHLVAREKLSRLEEICAKEGIKAKGAVDVNPLDERLAASVAGLGYLGHNRFLIHPVFGTHLYLATLLLDIPFSTKSHAQDSCGDCTACIEACPLKALGKGTYHVKDCLSHLTQCKEPIPLEKGKAFRKFLFGCDICQEVCPQNENIRPVERNVFQSDKNAQLPLMDILGRSVGSINREYAEYAFAWRGGLILKRNAALLLYGQGLTDASFEIQEAYEKHKDVSWFEETVRNVMRALKEDH